MEPEQLPNADVAESTVATEDVSVQETEPQTSVATEQPTESETARDPVSEMRSRYDSQLSAAKRALEESFSKQAQLEQQLFEAQIAHLPSDEQQAARQSLKQQQAVAQMAQVWQQEREQYETISKNLVVTNLSQKYGVPAADLADFDNPIAMEKYAKKVADLNKRARLEARKTTGADRAESGGSTAGFDEKKFVGSGNVRGAIKAMRDAGAW